MSRKRLLARLGAASAAVTLAVAGLTAVLVSPAAAGAITNVSPPFAFNTQSVTITFTAPGTTPAYLPSRATVTLSRPNSQPPSACAPSGVCPVANYEISTQILLESTEGSNTDTTYRATFNLAAGPIDATGPANPDTYDLTISEQRPALTGPTVTVSDSCSRCFTVLSPGDPTVTSTSVPNLRPGTTVSSYAITGTNFARGSGVQVLFGGAPDPTIRVTNQDLNSSGGDPNPDTSTSLTKKLQVFTNAPGGSRDIRVFNTDGGSTICSRCLSIDSLLVDSVNPGAVDNRSVKRIAVTGSRFAPGAQVVLTRFPALSDQPDIPGTDLVFVDNFNGTQTISATYDMTGVAPGANAWIPRVTNTDGGSGACTCRLSVASLAPTLTSISPASQPVGTDDAPETLAGTNFARGATITFSNPGVSTAPGSVRWVSFTTLEFLVDVASNAPVGKSDVTITNSDGLKATCVGCFEVTAAPPEPTPSETAGTQPPTPAQDNGVYTPLNPARILDTRDGTGGVRSPLGAGESRPFQVTGQGGVPAGASAVVFNLTAITPSSSGFVTAFPTGAARPNASNLNFVRNDVIANLVKVRIGSNGQVSLFNNSGTTNVAADVVGYYAAPGGGATPSETAAPSESASAAPTTTSTATTTAAPTASATPAASESPAAPPAPSGSRYTGVNPQRILDTRDGNGGSTRPIGPGESRVLQVTGRAGVPADATAVVFNLTAITPTASGFLTAFPSGTTRPVASNINFTRGKVIANLVIVRVGDLGRVSIYNNSGDTHAAADVVGFFSPATAAASYNSLQPQRILDTRDGSNSVARPIGHGESRSFRVTGLGGVPSNASAVVFNLTAITPTNAGFLTAYPAGSARPLASNINFVRGQVIPNLVIVRVGVGGQVTLFNNSGNTHAAADVVGYFGTFNPNATPTASPSPSPTATATAAPTVTPTATGTAAPTATPTAALVARRTPIDGGNGSPVAALGLFLLLGTVTGAVASWRLAPAHSRRH